MSCNCKKNQIDLPYSSKMPTTPCVFCAEKHFSTALVLSREAGYEYINKYFVIGELVLMQWHLYYNHPEICTKIREIRHLWQEEKWREALPLWGEISEELDKIKKNELSQPTYDIFIPFKAGASAAMDQELRYALRSIQKHVKNYRNIWIAGTSKPEWLQEVKFVQVKDDRGSKQMNIHDAIKAVLNQKECSDNIIFWADDNAVLKTVDARNFPIVVTDEDMMKYDSNGKWWSRTLRATGEILKAKNFSTISYESHTPVVFSKEKYLKMDEEFDYYKNPNGLCYISMYCNYYNLIPTHKQSEIKVTFQGEANKQYLEGKTFIGYNNGGVEGGVLKILQELFPNPSKYEKNFNNEKVYSENPTIGVVIDGYEHPDLIELQLHYLCRVNNFPVLVHDNKSSNQDEIKSVVNKFNQDGYKVDFVSTDTIKSSKARDCYCYSSGLKWANENNYDLLYKISQSWLIKKEWKNEAIKLAKETDGLTFSSYCTSKNKGFRTEFQGMNVKKWYQYVQEISDKAEIITCTIEGFFHDIAKNISNYVNQNCYEHMMSQELGADKQGYILIPFMGTDRNNTPKDILWVNSNSENDYKLELEKIRKNF